MRRFSQHVKHTLSGFLGLTAVQDRQDHEQQRRLDAIRTVMLEGLPLSRQMGLQSRIRHAETLETLWYARGELMAWMAVTHGEESARLHMHGVTRLFDGLLPRSMKARVSPLTH